MAYRLSNIPVPVVIAAGLVATITGIWGLWGVASGWSSPDGGQVVVIRNGGLFDDKQVRQVDGQPQILTPGSGLTWVGMFSKEHAYPATERYFKVSATPDADSNEVIQVPTKDGVQVGVEGVFWFTLNADPQVLAQFDDRFGTRTFPAVTERNADGTPAVTENLHAWEGDAAWSGFLSATLGNLVQNDLRREIGTVSCPDLVATCALAQSTAGVDAAAVIAAAANQPVGSDKITALQEEVNKQFAKDVNDTLGGPYFTNIRFVLSKVALPKNVQDSINDAQGAFASTTKAAAAKQAAVLEADAQIERQRGYNGCPTCAEVDVLKALPGGLTTYAPGGNYAVTGR